ncbi:MAG: lytic transglycosylase domain-containing protein [Selenomonadaceae bacterium]|nr:lytic transglycosylase domain-containing protein [Selenomonadaceae bacterium]MDY2685484.1 lytic transglycosylase domain-containing protein [Selenomonadaceae bacterium]
MINLNGVHEIQARIAAIQQKFGIPGGVPGMDFGSTLQKEIDKGSGGTQGVPARHPSAQARPAQDSAAPSMAAPAIDADLPPANPTLSNLIQEAAQKYQVDPKLVSAIAEVESGGNPSAISPAGAIGVMQLMPGTAEGLGVNPYDERQNIEGGAKYLRQMLDAFGGDVRKAVAAYNAGPQAVKEYGGVPPYRETQNYVNKVLDLYR